MTPTGEPGHRKLALLAELAPLGVLDLGEHRRIREHLDMGCGHCEAARSSAWEELEVLALATPLLAPADGGRGRLLASLGTLEGSRRRRASPAVGWLVAAGLATLGAGLGVVQWRQLRSERAARVTAQTGLMRLEAREARLLERNAVIENAIAVLGGPVLRTVSLSGGSGFAEARVRVLVDAADARALLLARELPAPPPGRTYQLWVVAGGAPRSLGVFRPDAQGSVLRVEPARLGRSGESQFAVSIEPEGGVPQPTGPIVLAGR